MLAIKISTSSPYRWPKRSLTCLKWSISTTANHCCNWPPGVALELLSALHAGVGSYACVAGKLVVKGFAVEQASQRVALAVVEQALVVLVDVEDGSAMS